MAIDLNEKYKNKELGTVIANPYRNITPLITSTEDRSQYDQGFVLPTQGGDPFAELQETRAQNQPGVDQLANGLIKGVGLMVTTFADTYGGTVAGIANMIVNGSEQGYINAFVNNPFSNAMQDINDSMESSFANYRTKAEQEMGVFEQMLTPNFWGDSFIKNLGFAGGAMAAGWTTGKLFGALTQGVRAKEEASLFKKMTENIITKDAKSVEEGIALLEKAEREGLLNVSASELKKTLEGSAKAYRNLNRANQLTSSALAATGEARIEALGNGRQFQQAKLQELDSEFKNPNGTFKIGKTQEEYNKKLNDLDDLVKGFQNSEFLINAALLTASNFAGYRNFFAKNYGLNANRFDDVISINSMKNVVAGEIPAKVIEQKWYQTLGKSALGSGREGLEEFFQTVTQKSADNYYSAKFNGMDPSAFSSLAAGINEAVGKEGLESFILGAMTGLLMPGGGLISEFKEAKQLNAEAAEKATNINNAVKEYIDYHKTNPESVFMNFHDMINRDINLNKAQLQALLNDDKYNYENLKNDKFFNMASAYINAGKYNDLVGMLEQETKLSVDDIKAKYSVPTDPADPNSPKKEFFKNWEDHEIKTYIDTQARKNTDAVKEIRDLMNDLETRYGRQLALIKSDDQTKKVEVKNILARHLYLAKTLDFRLKDVHNKLLKHITDALPNTNLDTGDGFAVTDFINNAFTQSEDVNDKTYKEVLKKITEIAKNSSDPKELLELFQDYIQLAGRRKAHNAAWLRLTENDFSNLLNRLQEEDNKQAKQNVEQAVKDLTDEDKINIVREKAKAAGYTGPGNYFTITDNDGKVRKYELEPVNLGAERKKIKDEFDDKLSQMDPTDTDAIKALEDEYNTKELDLVNNAKELAIKDFDTGEYLRANNKLQKFNDDFIKQNYNKIQFVSRQQATAIRRAKAIQDANRRKIDAIRQILNELNNDIAANIVQIDSLNNEKSNLEQDIKFFKEYLNTLTNDSDINETRQILDNATDRLNQLNTAIENIDKTIFQLNNQKKDLTTLALEIKEAFEKSEDMSIDEFVSKLDELNLSSVEKIWAKNLSKDLEDLANTDNIDGALYSLDVLKNNLEVEIDKLNDIINSLEESLVKSQAYKEWVLASKIDGLPEWFTSKWNVSKKTDPFKLASKSQDLQDVKRLYQFQKLMTKYANANGISNKEAYQEYLNDLEQLKQETDNFNDTLNRSYDEIKSIQEHLLLNKADLDKLKSQLADVLDVMEFNKKRSLVNNIQKYINQIKIKYTNIVNKETRSVQLPDSQIANDAPPADDITEQDNAQLNISDSAKSSTPFYTTNKTVEQNSDGTTKYDGEYPKLNPNADAIRWNAFLERNPDLAKNFALQAFVLQDLPNDSPLKKAALKRIEEGGGQVSDIDIITALVDVTTGELVKASIDGAINGETEQGLVYTFLPLTSNLLGSDSKVNQVALLKYFHKYGMVQTNVGEPMIRQDKSHDGDLVEFGKKGTPKITLAEFRKRIKDFAAAKHAEFIQQIVASSRSGQKVFLPIKGITNGILLKKKSVDGSNVMQPVRNVLAERRNIDTGTTTGLDDVEVYTIDKKADQYKIPGTNIIIDNPKLGATIIYNKKTKEYFYANQRNINDEEVDLIFYLLDLTANNPEKDLNIKLQVGGQKGRFYINNNNERISEVDIYKKFGGMSLMNNLIHWGGKPKSDATKHTIYIDKGRIYYPNPNNNFALESISLKEIRNTAKNKDLQAYLKTKRFNVNSNMMRNTSLYFHPTLKNGKLEWVAFKGGYKDMLLNGNSKMEPVLITSAVDSNNSNYKGNKLLFASKNITLELGTNGLPTIMNDYKKQQPATSPIVPPIRDQAPPVTEAPPIFSEEDYYNDAVDAWASSDAEIAALTGVPVSTPQSTVPVTSEPGVQQDSLFPMSTQQTSDTNQTTQTKVLEEEVKKLEEQCNTSGTTTVTPTIETPKKKFGSKNNTTGKDNI